VTFLNTRESLEKCMSTAIRTLDTAQEILPAADQKNEMLKDRIRLLESVIDNFPGGLLLFDKDLNLVLCNAQQKRLLDYPDELFANKNPSLQQMFMFNAQRGEYGPGDVNDLVKARMDLVATRRAHVFERKRPNGTIVEIRGMPLPDGGFVTTYLDVTEQRKYQALVAHLAHHDQLTSLPNRSLMLDRLQIALAGARRGRNVAIHYIDLDKFKPINDKCGHAVGDHVLKTAASRLLASVRETDTVARIGGDEFVIIQVDIETADDAAVLARRVISSVSTPQFLEDADISVNASMGIAFAPWDGDGADELLRKADQAMYRSKGKGGGAYSFYSRPPNSTTDSVDIHPAESSHLWLQDLN
jgi:diguanylate cyclase (GGDEF)-like protein